MCTVTYLPTGQNSFILTSNRDETPTRQPQAVFHDQTKGIIYPKEPSKGGSWICADEQQRVICLLNGAFSKHERTLPYRKSRGIVVLEFFDYPNAQAFFDNYNFDNIEPFTLIVSDHKDLFEFRWDGVQKHLKVLDSQQAYIWSSSTLYPEDKKILRREWFANWLNQHPNYSREAILDFHQHGGDGDSEYDLVMSRHGGLVQTVSITQIIKNPDALEMIYQDLIEEEKYAVQLAFV